MLSCRHDEQRVANVAANCAAGRARHRGRIGIHADHERVGLPRSSGEDRAAVARAEVYRYGGVVSCQASDIAGRQTREPRDLERHAAFSKVYPSLDSQAHWPRD
jgi:hypothetical protein